MRTVSRPELHVQDRGDGEPVLLITGWTISGEIFDTVLDRYTPHVRCVSYDHRGTARSAPWVGPVSMAMLAADAARVLDDRGIDSAHVAGASMGAMVALELALRMPHRVRSLILLGGWAGPAVPTPAVLRDRATLLARLARESVARRRPSLEPALFSPAFSASEPARAAELVRPFVRHRAPPWAAWAQTVAALTYDRVADLGRVRVPTIVVHGEHDLMVPLDSARTLARRIAGARLHVVPGAGHGAALEAADEVAGLLLDWVAEHAGPSRVPVASARERLTERATRPLALHAGCLRLAHRTLDPGTWRSPAA
jgi:pimeloyl-ACP methyl ester carboxylesterase